MRPFLEKQKKPLRITETTTNPFPEHLHSQLELLYLFEGSTTLMVNGRDQCMQPGDLCVCFPGVVHAYKGGDHVNALMMIFDSNLTDDFTSLMERVQPTDPLLRRSQLPADIPLCMEQLRKESKTEENPHILRGYLQVVVARILPLLHLIPVEPGSNDIAYEILEYLSKHYMEAVTQETLSKALGVSHSCLSHTFSKRIGVNFRTYLNTLRVDKANLLLRSTGQTIGQIALECGFESIRTFNRIFVQLCGMTPMDYRNQFLNSNKL